MSWSEPGGGWSQPPPRFDPQAQSAPLVQDQHEVEYVEPNKPPMAWLGVSLALSIAGLVIALAFKGATMGLVAWFLAGPLAITAVSLFTAADAKKRESGWYSPSDLAEWGRRIAIVLALVGVTAAAWLIANDVARGIWT